MQCGRAEGGDARGDSGMSQTTDFVEKEIQLRIMPFMFSEYK